MPDFIKLPAFGKDGRVHVVIETPKGARAKFKYEPQTGTFEFSRPLPLGLAYPSDWGFIPSTRGEDGDPLDALVLHEATSYPGIVLPCRALAVLQVEQMEKGKTKRNDRYIFTPDPPEYPLANAYDVSRMEKDDLEQFFVASTLRTGKMLKFLSWRDGAFAMDALKQAARAFEAK